MICSELTAFRSTQVSITAAVCKTTASLTFVLPIAAESELRQARVNGLRNRTQSLTIAFVTKDVSHSASANKGLLSV